jgi:uncharacterized protein YjdB
MTLQCVRARGVGFPRRAPVSVALASALLLALLSPRPAAAATLDSITVTPADSTMRAGFAVRFVATGHYSDGSSANVSAIASWSSTSPGVVIVNNNTPISKGIVTAVARGTARVVAEVTDGLRVVRGSTQVTVIEGDLVSITTKPTTKNLEVGQTSQFKATALFLDDSTEDVTDEVEWFSSNPSIASVSNVPPTKGLVTPHAPGNVVITARDPDSGVQNTDGAAVVRARVSHLSFDPPAVTIGKGIKYPLRVYANRVDGSRSNITEDVEYSVVPGGIIRVGTGDAAGIVTPLENGVATVSAFDPKRQLSTASSGTSARVAVRGKLRELHVEPNPTRIAVGEEKNARAFGLLSSGVKTSDLRRIVQWSVADPTVASVGNTVNDVGELLGKKSGVTTLRASYGGMHSPETDNLQVLGPIQSLDLEIGDGLFPMGEEIETKARATYAGGIELNVSDRCTWTVVNPDLAQVDDDDSAVDGDGKGGVTGKALGQTTLRAACEGKQAAKVIRVIGTLTGLRVDPQAYEAEALEEKQFRAWGNYSDGSEKDLTKLVSWSSSNTAVATVDNVDDRGTVVALGTGSSTITATKAPFVASGVIAVAVGIVRIELVPDGRTVRGSDSFKMKANGIRANNDVTPVTKRVVWSSANPQIARVSNRVGEQGFVFGGGVEGTTEITATLPGTEFSDSASVTTSCLMSSMHFQPAAKTWPVGQARRTRIIANYNCPLPSTRNITTHVEYTSSNPNVVTVSNEPKAVGVMTAIGPGTATITAFDPSSGQTATNTLQVTIVPSGQ